MGYDETNYADLIDTPGAAVPADLIQLAYDAGRGEAILDAQNEGAHVEQRMMRQALQDRAHSFWAHSDEEDGPVPQDDAYYERFEVGTDHDLSGMNQD